MLFIYNTDKPGVIGAIGTTIGKHNINIARMTVGQEKDRGQNIILLTTDTPVTSECLADVRALPHVAIGRAIGTVSIKHGEVSRFRLSSSSRSLITSGAECNLNLRSAIKGRDIRPLHTNPWHV